MIRTPWHLCHDFDNPEDSIVIGDAENNDIAEVFSRERDTVPTTIEEARAIARLMAAAPEMFEALREALLVLEAMHRLMASEARARGMGGDGPVLERVRAVLAKVEGRS
jgi:hypothetical protein